MKGNDFIKFYSHKNDNLSFSIGLHVSHNGVEQESNVSKSCSNQLQLICGTININIPLEIASGSMAVQPFGTGGFFSVFPFYPLSSSWCFNLSCPRRLPSPLEPGSQVGSTTDHLSSCCLVQHTDDLSRAKPPDVIANRG